MLIQVVTDNHIRGSEELEARVSSEVEAALGRFADRITRVEVHLGDLNSDKKSGVDKRCRMEARLGGLNPIYVNEVADTVDGAVRAAAEALERTLDKHLDKLSERKGDMPMGGEGFI